MLKVDRQCKLQPKSDYCFKHKKYAPDSESSEVNTITTSAYQSIESSTVTDTIMCQHQDSTPMKESVVTPAAIEQDIKLPIAPEGTLQSYRILVQGTDDYEHPLTDLYALISVRPNKDSSPRFYWFYGRCGESNMRSFVYNAHKLGFECHEVMWRDHCNFFIDIDLVLTNAQRDQYLSAMDSHDELIGSIACAYEDAVNLSLSKHGLIDKHGLNEFDPTIITRIRQQASGDWKYSMHLISNWWMPIRKAKALATDAKNQLASVDTQLDKTMLSSAFDMQPYCRRKSLSMVGGCKDGHVNKLHDETHSSHMNQYISIISESSDALDMQGYDSPGYVAPTFVDDDFVTEALQHVGSIADWNDSAFDIQSSRRKGHTMYVRRVSPSHCTPCGRTHDVDATMLLSFNSETGCAFWKCMHSQEKKPKLWFKRKPAVKLTALGESELPPIFDKNNPCCFGDSVGLQQLLSMTWAQSGEFVRNSIAYITNGGSSYFMTKNFADDGTINYKTIPIKDMKAMLVFFKLPDKDGNIRPTMLYTVVLAFMSDITYGVSDFKPYGKRSEADYTSNRLFNTFTGFVHDYDESFVIDHSKIKRYLDHLNEVWCRSDAKLFEATIKHFACIVQRPNKKTQTCLVVLGREGSGKNRLTDILRDYVIGRKYVVETSKMDKLTGRFNGMSEDKILGALNEASNVSQKNSCENQEILKDLITNETNVIERKYMSAKTVNDYCNYICFSNNYYVIQSSTELRRFVFYDVSSHRIGDKAYFKALSDDFELHGAGIHLYHYLMSIDVSDFDSQRDFPTTAIKESMKMDAIDRSVQWLISCVNEEVGYGMTLNLGKNNFVSVKSMRDSFNKWLEEQGETKLWKDKRFGGMMTKVLGSNKLEYVDKVRTRGYIIDLEDLKKKLIEYTRRSDLFDIKATQ